MFDKLGIWHDLDKGFEDLQKTNFTPSLLAELSLNLKQLTTGPIMGKIQFLTIISNISLIWAVVIPSVDN